MMFGELCSCFIFPSVFFFSIEVQFTEDKINHFQEHHSASFSTLDTVQPSPLLVLNTFIKTKSLYPLSSHSPFPLASVSVGLSTLDISQK